MESEEVCCGKLFYAEVIKNVVVLECCTCGKRWQAQSKGGFVPFRTDGGGASVRTIGKSVSSFIGDVTPRYLDSMNP
jgi:hypothetical protein